MLSFVDVVLVVAVLDFTTGNFELPLPVHFVRRRV
jgi:hypothetical protein